MMGMASSGPHPGQLKLLSPLFPTLGQTEICSNTGHRVHSRGTVEYKQIFKKHTEFLHTGDGNLSCLLNSGFFLDISKKTQGQKNSSRKKLKQIFKKLKQIIQKLNICQLKTDFLLKKVLKLVYFAQKIGQT